VFEELRQLWLARNRTDEYFGTLVNAFLAEGGKAAAVKAGQAYVDVGTLHGYRAALSLLEDIRGKSSSESGAAAALPHMRRDNSLHAREVRT